QSLIRDVVVVEQLFRLGPDALRALRGIARRDLAGLAGRLRDVQDFVARPGAATPARLRVEEVHRNGSQHTAQQDSVHGFLGPTFKNAVQTCTVAHEFSRTTRVAPESCKLRAAAGPEGYCAPRPAR